VLQMTIDTTSTSCRIGQENKTFLVIWQNKSMSILSE